MQSGTANGLLVAHDEYGGKGKQERAPPAVQRSASVEEQKWLSKLRLQGCRPLSLADDTTHEGRRAGIAAEGGVQLRHHRQRLLRNDHPRRPRRLEVRAQP